MDLALQILGIIAAVLGSGGIGILLFYKLKQRQLLAATGLTEAEEELTKAKASSTEAGTLESIIGVLRGELDRLAKRLGDLEERVTALELENRGLRQMVDQFRALVRRLWAIVKNNDLEADSDLAEAVYEALEDSAV